MDHYPRVIEMRQRALDWFASMQVIELGFGVHADSAFHKENGPRGMYLPGTYNATNCLFLLGKYDAVTSEQADSLANFLNQFQRDDGAYRIPEMVQADIYYPDFEYVDFHITNYTLGALALLGRAPTRPFSFMAHYNTPQKLSAWLDTRQMSEPWTEGNYIVNLASFYAYLLENGDERYRLLLHHLLDWHETQQDATSGYWYDPSTQDLTSAMAGAAHNLHLYYYLNRPIPRYEKIVDHCLGILEGVTSACLDIDVVDILANLHIYGYRQSEIEAYLEQKLASLYEFQNPDGGFSDVKVGIRLFDGWERYQEPQGMSNTFSTWFRCASIGMICHVLYPDARSQWRFRNTLGMGYFEPRLPEDSGMVAVVEPSVQQNSKQEASIKTISSVETFGKAAEKILERIQNKFASMDPMRLKSIEAVYQIEVSGQDGGSLSVVVSEETAIVKAGDNPQARVWLTTSAETLNKLLDGKLNTTVAYMTKRLKIRGDIAQAMKLESLLR
jgi:putative sterol carrier protein